MDERNKQTNSNRLIDTEKRMTPVRMAIINKSKKKTASEKKGELFCTVGGNTDWCSHCEKQYGNT